jgi:hypothetical protein
MDLFKLAGKVLVREPLILAFTKARGLSFIRLADVLKASKCT